jgi:hypothetical protein
MNKGVQIFLESAYLSYLDRSVNKILKGIFKGGLPAIRYIFFVFNKSFVGTRPTSPFRRGGPSSNGKGN